MEEVAVEMMMRWVVEGDSAVDYLNTAAAAVDSIDNTVTAEQLAVRSKPSMQQFV